MSCWTKEQLESMLEDVVNELDLSESMIEKHGPFGTAPAELVKVVLEQKDRKIKMLERGVEQGPSSADGSTAGSGRARAGLQDGVVGLLRPGNKIRLFYGGKNINNKLIHIRSIVDEDVIVFKTWFKTHQRWHYECENIYYFDMLYKQNILHLVGKS